jgi:hypothetical protein
MKRNQPEHYFERPMLNSPAVGNTVEADYLVRRVRIRLDASHEANKIMVECMYSQLPPFKPEPAFRDWSGLLSIWQSLQNRYATR